MAFMVALAATPALSETCTFVAPNGPTMEVSGPFDDMVVHAGDWDETCHVERDERGDPHIPGASGWIVPNKLVCRAFQGQISYVDGTDHTVMVFNGLTFTKQSCKAD